MDKNEPKKIKVEEIDSFESIKNIKKGEAMIKTNSYYNDLMLLSRIQIPIPYMEIVISNLIVISVCIEIA